MSPTSLQQPTTRIAGSQACDGCKKRKIKCDRERPCGKCLEAALVCTYDAVPLRKGRRGRTARVLSTLRAATASQSLSPREEGRDETGSEGSACTYRTSPPSSLAGFSHSFSDRRFPLPPATTGEVPLFGEQITHSSHGDATSKHCNIRGRIASTVLQAHVRVFLKHLFPIMPVFQPDVVLYDCNDPESLSEQQYAFLVALCAATHIQLNLDHPGPASPRQSSRGPGCPPASLTGELFIEEVKKARQELELPAHPNCTTLLTSFFLFAAYGNLNQPHYALFYLHQAISFAFVLGLHNEDTYTGLLPSEADQRRRIYWLLFITERAYSLQMNKPILLSPSIRKPEVFSSSNPLVAYGFLNLIQLFEKLDSSLYQHNSPSSSGSYHGKAHQDQSVVGIYNDVSAFEPCVDEVHDTQKVDILVTHNWLQITLLAAVGKGHTRSPGLGLALSGQNQYWTLMSHAKSIMETISSAPQSSVAAHGIGMEQKLYDVAASAVKTLASLTPSEVDVTTAMVVNPKDLVWEYIRVLSDIRGNRSYLLPKLVQYSESFLGLTSPLQLPVLSCLPSIRQGMSDDVNSGNELNEVLVDWNSV